MSQTRPDRPPSSAEQDNRGADVGNSARPRTLVETLRQQPAAPRRSKIGNVLTRQPDYEERHLEMMRYLASLRNGGKDAASAVLNSSRPSASPAAFSQTETPTGATTNGGEKLFMGSAYKEEALHRYHETEVQRLRHSVDGHRRFKNAAAIYSACKQVNGGASATAGSKDAEEELFYDPATGLPRANMATMGLRQAAVGVSPWRVLFHYIRQSLFRSTSTLALILAFVILLNLRRFSILFQPLGGNQTETGSNSAVSEAVMTGDS